MTFTVSGFVFDLVVPALLIGSFALSALITEYTRRYGLRAALIDIPNERSSHTLPTVTGGGLGIALTFLLALFALAWNNSIPSNLAWVLIGGGGLIAWVGWRDDHRHVDVRWRLLAQAVAAVWALVWLGVPQNFSLGGFGLASQWLTWLLSILGIIWFTNLYNFMDGIDGLAGSQAVCACLAGGALLYFSGAYELARVTLVLGGASLGFLLWNWPVARIFMGDVGSGLLGYSFAVLALASEQAEALPGLVWIILLAVFITDASFTLLRRMVRGDPWYQAHRTHAYQHLVQTGWTHLQVVLAILALNMFVLWPMAWLAVVRPSYLPEISFIILFGSWLLWIMIQCEPFATGKIE